MTAITRTALDDVITEARLTLEHQNIKPTDELVRDTLAAWVLNLRAAASPGMARVKP